MTRPLFAGRGAAISLAGLSCLLLASASCGGHHNSSNSSTSIITATIDWPAQSRDISSVSSSALACIITAETGDPNNGDDAIDFAPIIRPAIAADTPQTQSWSSTTTTLNPGTRTFQIRFYSVLPTGTTSGVANDTINTNYENLASVGDATITVNVQAPTTDLGVVSMTGAIGALIIPPSGQSSVTVDFGDFTTLAATAYALDKLTVIAIPSGAVFYSAPSNPAFTVDQAGDVVTTGLGTAVVTASTQKTTGVLVTNSQGTIVPTDAAEVTTSCNVSSIVGASRLVLQPDGVSSVDTATGTAGTAATATSAVSVQYGGYYSNDPGNNVDSGSYTNFDTAHGAAPVALNLGDGSVPPGLVNAIVGLNVGATRIAVIPSSQTAGLGLPSSAPANAPAIYIISRTK